MYYYEKTHNGYVFQPMWAIQDVARTQSVQDITGNSPLSICTWPILILDVLLKPPTLLIIQRSITNYLEAPSLLIYWLPGRFLSLGHPLLSPLCIGYWIYWLEGCYWEVKLFQRFKLDENAKFVSWTIRPITDSCRFSSRPPISWLCWPRNKTFQLQKRL